MRNSLIILGLMFLLTGLFWPWLSRIPMGRLPGDIIINRPGLKVFIPITTMILISLALSLIAWFFRK